MRSAMAPETIVAAVAANAAWKKNVVEVNSPSLAASSMPSTPKPPQPNQPPSSSSEPKAML